MYIYTHETISTLELMNISFTPNFLMLPSAPPFPPKQPTDLLSVTRDWFAFSKFCVNKHKSKCAFITH